MCSPVAMLGMQAAGAASSAVGSYYSAQGQQSAMRGQAEQLELTAQRTLEAGQRETQRSRMATARLKGAQRAGMAANGLDLGEGTAARVLTDTDLLGEVDANTIEANAVRSAWGYRTESTMRRAGADAISPGMAGFTSLLGGTGQVASSWYAMNKVGAG